MSATRKRGFLKSVSGGLITQTREHVRCIIAEKFKERLHIAPIGCWYYTLVDLVHARHVMKFAIAVVGLFLVSFILFSGIRSQSIVYGNTIRSEAAEGLAQSDDFSIHRKAFEEAARELIKGGRCSRVDIAEWGGFVKSVNRGPGHYFIYCGGLAVQNRVYIRISGDGYLISH